MKYVPVGSLTLVTIPDAHMTPRKGGCANTCTQSSLVRRSSGKPNSSVIVNCVCPKSPFGPSCAERLNCTYFMLVSKKPTQPPPVPLTAPAVATPARTAATAPAAMIKPKNRFMPNSLSAREFDLDVAAVEHLVAREVRSSRDQDPVRVTRAGLAAVVDSDPILEAVDAVDASRAIELRRVVVLVADDRLHRFGL